MVIYVTRLRTVHSCTAPTSVRLEVFIRNHRLTGIISMCWPCDVLNYLVSTELQDHNRLSVVCITGIPYTCQTEIRMSLS
jgi:hypothetical protein